MYDIYTYLCTACVNLLICFLNETFVFITKSCWHVLIETLFCLVTIPWHSCSMSRHTVSMRVWQLLQIWLVTVWRQEMKAIPWVFVLCKHREHYWRKWFCRAREEWRTRVKDRDKCDVLFLFDRFWFYDHLICCSWKAKMSWKRCRGGGYPRFPCLVEWRERFGNEECLQIILSSFSVSIILIKKTFLLI